MIEDEIKRWRFNFSLIINSWLGHRLSVLKSYCSFQKRKNILARHSINKTLCHIHLVFWSPGISITQENLIEEIRWQSDQTGV